MRKKLRMRWFSDVSTVKGSRRLLENRNFSRSKIKTLKKFDIVKEMQRMVNFKSNYGVHKVEKAWQNFPHSNWLVKIITS